MARLLSYVHVTDEDGAPHVFGPASDIPAWAEKAISNPKAWAEAPEPVAESTGYEGKSKADLEAEIAKRNEGRAEGSLIKPDGKQNKPDLIAALEADDQKSS